MKKILLILFTVLSISCFAQFSKTHYIPPITAQNDLVEDHYLYISTPSTSNVNFKIIANGGAVITGVVSNTNPYRYDIGQGDDTQLFTPKTSIGTIKNKGYIIEAENLIYVSVRVNASQNRNGTYNHAGGLVSKGNSALGKIFRLGAMLNPLYDTTLLNFASVLSTENNTRITISNIPNGTLLTDGTIISGPIVVTLNKNESYVLALENYSNTISNSSKMIGALVESDKPVVVNSGSFGGSNNTLVTGTSPMGIGRDVGFDQIVPLEKTGKEYIFVKGNGTDELERIILVAHSNNTEIFTNGNLTPVATLNAGSYYVLNGSNFLNGNLYVTSSENIFAYQCIGGLRDTGLNKPSANQNLFFVPPINCSTPNIVDNIPYIESIGNTKYTGGINIVTETGASVLINGSPITATAVPITGNPSFERYTISGLYGNIAVKSTKQVYVSYFGTNGAATYGGYYSGFDTKPEIVTDKISVTNSTCIPNVILRINSLSSYDSFQWYKNDIEITGETFNSYRPTEPGYYQVKGAISSCPNTVPIFSDKIPVSNCPDDTDADGANDNIDIDLDNDGITNCIESYGNESIDISNIANGTISKNTYSNTFSGTLTSNSPITPTTFVGKTNGDFTTEVPSGNGNSLTYTMNFATPVSLALEYIKAGNSSDLLNSNSDFILKSPTNKTVTVLNPTNQLLIDTNYDGIFESNITEFSSFEIRFRLNNAVPLAAGAGDFSFRSFMTESISFTQKNLTDTQVNKATFTILATCIPRDTDLDGVPDQLDLDSDNDGIPDIIEAQGTTVKTISNTDTNKNGLDNAFEPGFTPTDTDNDGVPDYLDWDSDNDGIYDSVETGSLGTDTDGDGIKNYRELDSDNDNCNDVIEAGFADSNDDGLLGSIVPPTVDSKGIVTSRTNGYTAPNSNYTTAAPIVITAQPFVPPTCELQNATVTVADNGSNTYQWELSTNGTTWTTITNNTTYSQVTTNSLLITSVKNAMNGYKYRVQLSKVGNSCGLVSSETTLTVYTLPVVSNITIIQCDDDLDAVTTFNLTVKNDVISSNYVNESFAYYTSFTGATTANSAELITNPLAFTNTTPSLMKVWARVVNSNGCFSVAELTLKVLSTQIPNTFQITYRQCDDLLDVNGNNTVNNDKRDGISTFNFSNAKTNIEALLPVGNYSITFYRNQADALAEINVITDISNYRNIGYKDTQQIWGRVDSDTDNACYGLGPYVNLIVEALPFANPVTIPRQCDDNQDGIFTFNTTTLENSLLNGQNNVTVTYFDTNNNALPSPFPASFTTTTQTIKAVITNNSLLACYDETLITFTVDARPAANAIPISLTTACDDEQNPLLQDGKLSFDTSTYETTILGGQIGMTVKYFDQNGNLLSSPLPNPFVTGTQNIAVTVENTINPTCVTSISIPFVVHALPNIELNSDGSENELVCSNLPTFFVRLDAGIQDGSPASNYNYQWAKDNVNLVAETNDFLNVNEIGTYTVRVTTLNDCDRVRTIKVTASDIAHLQNITVVDLANINTVVVNVTGQGDYEYSLDDSNGPFQSSNFFDNVPAGIHEVYIHDINGCGTVSKTIAVLGVPRFFTPNGDGYNDYWNLKGVNASFNSKSTIFIFDRYGKLLKQVIPTSQGWDGTFNGLQLPSDDYWYTIKLEDGRQVNGHFSLKR